MAQCPAIGLDHAGVLLLSAATLCRMLECEGKAFVPQDAEHCIACVHAVCKLFGRICTFARDEYTENTANVEVKGTLPIRIEKRHGLNLGTARPALRRAG